MGSVYEAVQESPRRSVALKVMNAAVATDEVAARLEYEAQLLARLRHPGIAEIYEAGTYEQDGRQLPFFAMEYIPNARSLTGYAREKKLSLREKLELFAEACDAVHHGHQRSIVHRDLKPANMLVDSSGRVRIIDFGIARATDADMRQTEVRTEVGQLVGSAAYMSPEQFEADPRDIDTRSDVYALGVVLYELLAGTMPYEAKSGSIYEVALMIKEDRPAPLGAINTECKGDLETIVDKALQKDRNLRYESAHGFAADIRRYLNGEAISARPPSLKYQVQVFARRNRALVTALAAVLVLLLGGVTTTTWLYLSVNKERARAEAESRSATLARDFLTEALSAAVPHQYGQEVTVGDICDHAQKKIDGAFPDAPQTEADVRRSLGLAYLNLDRLEESESQLIKALELRRQALGPNHPRTIDAMYDLRVIYDVFRPGREQVALSEDLVEACDATYGPMHDSTVGARMELAYALEAAGDLTRALETAREAADLCAAHHGPEHELSLDTRQQYAWLLMQTGAEDRALSIARECYDQAMTAFPEEDPNRRATRSMLAAALLAKGDEGAAKALYGHLRMPEQMSIERVFQGAFSPGGSPLEILVFWEAYCPFSQRAVPKLERVYRTYRDFGVDVIGFTAVRRSSTDAKVEEFLREKEITFPVVKEPRMAFGYFHATGTPFVCVLHEGELVWEGYVLSAEAFSAKLVEGILQRT
jgi:tetratricopeptide (TPR) repeat protein